MKNSHPMSRRFALRALGLGATASVLGAAIPSPRVSSFPRKTDVFALIGDRWHSFDYIRTALTRTLVKEAGASVTFTPDYTLLTREILAEHRLLLMLCDGLSFPGGYTSPYPFFDPGKTKIVSEPALPALDETAVNWLTPEQGKAVREFVENGGAAWFFHNTSYISGGNADFRHVQGALFTGHTIILPYKMKIMNRDHPITRGVQDFIVTEEQHFLIYDKDPKNVLVRSINEQGLKYETPKYGNQGASCEACWAYDYGKGRVCFMAPGHTIPSFWNPEYMKLQKNALRWLLGET